MVAQLPVDVPVSYRKIPNLYRPEGQAVLMFRQVYVMEKIHGTSAHVTIQPDDEKPTHFFGGGMKQSTFSEVFDGVRCPTEEQLRARWREHMREERAVTIYGEAFGGKEQGMSSTYGKEARFYAFEVKMGDAWLSVPYAHTLCAQLGIPFVWYELIDCTLEALDRARDRHSQVARDVLGIETMQEGIVIRPPIEVTGNDGRRFLCKHKRAEFSERATTPTIDPEKREQQLRDKAAAAEFVNVMRVRHVVDALASDSAKDGGQTFAMDMRYTPDMLRALSADVMTEEGVPDSPAFRKAVSQAAIPIWKSLVSTAGLESVMRENE